MIFRQNTIFFYNLTPLDTSMYNGLNPKFIVSKQKEEFISKCRVKILTHSIIALLKAKLDMLYELHCKPYFSLQSKSYSKFCCLSTF